MTWGERADRLASLLFEDGWRFFLPYFVLYLIGVGLSLPVALVGRLFLILHAGFGLLLLRWAWTLRSSWSWPGMLFWAGLALLFVVPGAYLEFPADPWEHASRIYAWNSVPGFRAHFFMERVPYFWSWSLIGDVPVAHRRTALTLLSAFFQLLICHQFERLARRLGASPAWARVQVVGVIAFFGNVFGFLRYYALASTSLAFVAYLAALRIGLDLAERRRSRWLELLLACGLMAASHLQELLLFGVSGAGLVGHALWCRPAARRRLVRLLPRLAAAGVLAGGLFLRMSGTDLTYPPLKLGDVLDAPTLVGLGIAVGWWPSLGALATLTLTPALALTWPPTALGLEAVLGRPEPLAWRVLYAFPASFALVAGLSLAVTRIEARWSRRAARLTAVVAVAGLLALALRPHAPLRGRLWFFLHEPAQGLSLEFADEAARWLARNRLADDGRYRGKPVVPAEASVAWQQPPPYSDVRGDACVLVTDTATAVGLGVHLDVWARALRRQHQRPPPLDVGLAAFLDRVPVCGFLIAREGGKDVSPTSLVATLSLHWGPSAVRDDVEAPSPFPDLEASLASRGWTSTPVPPFYVLWEAPQEPGKAGSIRFWRAGLSLPRPAPMGDS